MSLRQTREVGEVKFPRLVNSQNVLRSTAAIYVIFVQLGQQLAIKSPATLFSDL